MNDFLLNYLTFWAEYDWKYCLGKSLLFIVCAGGLSYCILFIIDEIISYRHRKIFFEIYYDSGREAAMEYYQKHRKDINFFDELGDYLNANLSDYDESFFASQKEANKLFAPIADYNIAHDNKNSSDYLTKAAIEKSQGNIPAFIDNIRLAYTVQKEAEILYLCADMMKELNMPCTLAFLRSSIGEFDIAGPSSRKSLGFDSGLLGEYLLYSVEYGNFATIFTEMLAQKSWHLNYPLDLLGMTAFCRRCCAENKLVELGEWLERMLAQISKRSPEVAYFETYLFYCYFFSHQDEKLWKLIRSSRSSSLSSQGRLEMCLIMELTEVLRDPQADFKKIKHRFDHIDSLITLSPPWRQLNLTSFGAYWLTCANATQLAKEYLDNYLNRAPKSLDFPESNDKAENERYSIIALTNPFYDETPLTRLASIYEQEGNWGAAADLWKRQVKSSKFFWECNDTARLRWAQALQNHGEADLAQREIALAKANFDKQFVQENLKELLSILPEPYRHFATDSPKVTNQRLRQWSFIAEYMLALRRPQQAVKFAFKAAENAPGLRYLWRRAVEIAIICHATKAAASGYQKLCSLSSRADDQDLILKIDKL